ncbi:hypothetical protein MOBT1_002737 [Malassezia obtusa]|uniref:Small ribosomal subunit protein mS29 n=1 Tax=Malassezia obtusa TaxID=76774 RepID=A0AAF0ISU0_9BASI|nr:hypothetical protein MOBT1_002737 [Malassezia obtusa]
MYGSDHFRPAPDMSDLLELDASAISAGALATPLAWSNAALKALSRFGLPQEIQRCHALQPRPRSIVRKASVALVEGLEKAAQNGAGCQMLIGEPGCGKSTYLLQAVAHALSAGWAVVYVPRAITWIDSSTAYVYNAGLQTYLQPPIVDDLLAAMLNANRNVFKRITTKRALQADGKEIFGAGTKLDVLVDKTLKEHTSPVTRQLVLELVWSTLAEQTEVPVLVALDDAQVLFGETRYRDPDFAPLQAFEMAVPRSMLNIFLAPASGAGVKRGAVLTTMSMAHANYPPPPELLVALREAATGEGAPVEWSRVKQTLTSPTSPTRIAEPHAYTKVHDQHIENARMAKFALVDVGERLSRPEAATLLSLMYRENMLWATPNDELFLEKLVESNGNIRAFEQGWRKSLV